MSPVTAIGVASAVPMPATAPAGGVTRWSTAVTTAAEPCLIIDREARIVAASASCHELLSLGPPGAVIGRHLLDGVVRLVDFTAARDDLTDVEIDKIPPILALSSGRLARGLMRVSNGQDHDVTVDAIATPLCDGPTVVASLTFFSAI